MALNRRVCLLFLAFAFGSRVKSTLLFPPLTVLQVTMGISCPAIFPNRSITLSLCAQFNYNLPFNTTNFIQPVIKARKEDIDYDLSRNEFYEKVIDYLDNFGFNGKQCLLRSICEIGEIPMDLEHQGVLERILHFLLTPTEDVASNLTSNQFVHAELNGRRNGNCREIYTGCRIPIIELITKLFYAK